jgi:Leucine-rich repeat (LRR) protein
MRALIVFLLFAATLAAADLYSWIVDAGGFRSGSSVDLRASWITDSDVPLLARMPDLTQLDLSLTRISDRGLRALRPASKIVALNLSFAEQIGDEGTAAIRDWKHLVRLNLRGTKVTDATLEMLARLTTLQVLDVSDAQLTDLGLNHLTSLTNLRELSMGGNKLTDAGLQFLRQLPQLVYLDLAGVQRTDSGLWSITLSESGLDAIVSVTELKELHLGGTAIGASGLKRLRSLPALERLSLQGCKRVTHDSAAVLAGFAKLRWLDVNGTGLAADDIASLQKALPACEILK